MNYKKIFVIFDTKENSFVSFNGRTAWAKEGTAKNSYNRNCITRLKFDKQTRYIILPICVDECVATIGFLNKGDIFA